MVDYAERARLRGEGKCPECKGTGSVDGDDPYEPGNQVVCRECGGTGKHPKPRKYKLNDVL